MHIFQAQLSDLEALVALRIKAMQPSLEAVGRFDPARARERFVNSFSAANTFKVLIDQQLVGFYVVIEKTDHLGLDHLYIDPQLQGNSIGKRIIETLKQQATSKAVPLRLGALQESRANAFYLQQGFVQIDRQEWDNIYQWSEVKITQ